MYKTSLFVLKFLVLGMALFNFKLLSKFIFIYMNF